MLFKYLKRLKHPFSNKNSIIDKKNTITLLRNYNCEFFLLSNISVDDQAPNAQIYFMNHITKTTQWEDPRKVNAPQHGSRACLWSGFFLCVVDSLPVLQLRLRIRLRTGLDLMLALDTDQDPVMNGIQLLPLHNKMYPPCKS